MSKLKIKDAAFAERMQKILNEQFNSNASSFAKAVGVSVSSLNRWIIGEADPSRTNLMKIADTTNASLSWLAYGREDIETSAQEPEQPYTVLEDYEIIRGYDVRASAGDGAYNTHQISVRSLAFRKAWLQERHFKSTDLVQLWAQGDSMQPTIHDGDSLVINITHRTPVDGRIYVIRNGKELLVKRIQSLINGLRLISDNKELYEPMELTDIELTDVEIIGQVVHVSHDFPI